MRCSSPKSLDHSIRKLVLFGLKRFIATVINKYFEKAINPNCITLFKRKKHKLRLIVAKYELEVKSNKIQSVLHL